MRARFFSAKAEDARPGPVKGARSSLRGSPGAQPVCGVVRDPTGSAVILRGSIERSRPGERGAALLLFTLMTFLVVLPMIGLAIDGGISYFAHSRLSSAVDAAALAGARSLNVGEDLPSQVANAQAVAQNYFNANFPPGILGSSNIQAPAAQITQTSYHTITVQFQASSDIQLYFMPLLGYPTSHISASATTSRRDVNIMLVIDRSGSMVPVCGVMKADAENFVSRFVDGRDRLGLVTFMGNAKSQPTIDYPATKNFKSQNPSLTDTIGQLACGGNTGSAAALSLAHGQIVLGAEPGALNVIVFFTDGVPNGFTSDQFALQPAVQLKWPNCPALVNGYLAEGGLYDATVQAAINSTDTPLVPNCPSGSERELGKYYQFIPKADFWGNSATGYNPVTTDASGNIQLLANSDAVSTNAADDAALKIRQDPPIIVIYTIGLGSNGGVDSAFLARVANDTSSSNYNSTQPTGKYYYSPNIGQLGAAFDSIASEILRIAQ